MEPSILDKVEIAQKNVIQNSKMKYDQPLLENDSDITAYMKNNSYPTLD